LSILVEHVVWHTHTHKNHISTAATAAAAAAAAAATTYIGYRSREYCKFVSISRLGFQFLF
jgi:hypothetical protein